MPNDKAYFYYRSYCDTDVNGYTISGDYEDTANAIDRNKNTYAVTDGSSDGDSVDFIVDLLYERDIDTIAIKSNLKTFGVYYWNGSSYTEIESYASNAEEFLVINFSEISSNKIKITATHTIVADEEKKLYIVDITKEITSLNIADISIEKDWERINMQNIYGGSVQVIKYANHGKVTIDLTFGNLTTDYTSYKLLKDRLEEDSYTIYIYYSDTYDLLTSSAWYLVNDVEKFDSTPHSETLVTGVKGSLKLREC